MQKMQEIFLPGKSAPAAPSIGGGRVSGNRIEEMAVLDGECRKCRKYFCPARARQPRPRSEGGRVSGNRIEEMAVLKRGGRTR